MKIVNAPDKANRPYRSPVLRKLTIQQARSYVREHTHELLDMIFPAREKAEREPEVAVSPPAPAYEAPRLTKLAPEQAKLKLVGQLSLGDQGARDLLDLLFPVSGADEGGRRER